MRFQGLFILLILIGLSACSDDDTQSDTNQPGGCSFDIDSEAMYANYADNLIIPDYNDFQQKLQTVSSNFQVFNTEQSSASLETLRDAMLEAWLAWQDVAHYDFGPAANANLTDYCNRFPLDTTQVQEQLEAGMIDLSNIEQYDKGFPALDYLLFHPQALDRFTGMEGAVYLDYTSQVIQTMLDKTELVVSDWENGYRSTFVSSKGNADGSALSGLVNSLNENYEFIKREKLGIPSGVLTLNNANPDRVEAPFSQYSQPLALRAMESSLRYFNGGSSLGLDDLVEASGATKSDGTLLKNAILSQYNAGITAVRNIGTPMQETLESNQSAVITAYNEVTKNIVNLKTDMPSVLCVAITYVDNPSDSD